MKTNRDTRKTIAIIGVISVVLLIGIGLFFYHNFFRQANAKLIETIPPDASFVFQVNDNDNFIKTSTQLLPYLTELLSMKALPGLEFLIDQFPVKKNEVMISCHFTGDNQALLLSTHIKESDFKRFLNILQIDARNFIPFDKTNNIYTYGTHLKKFFFVHHNNIISISEDIELLKKSITQLKHPRNLLNNKEFNSIYQLISKNTKQNFLILNNALYFEKGKIFLSENYQSLTQKLADISVWSAFQVRFTDKEIIMAGYLMDASPFFQKLKGQYPIEDNPTNIIPFNAPYYVGMKTPNAELFLQFFKKKLPHELHNEIACFDHLNPKSNYYFCLQKDTVTYNYLALNIDTPLTKVAAIFPDSGLNDNIKKYKQHAIYHTNLKNFNALLSTFHQDVALSYFVEYQEYYIFSETIQALEYYLSQIQNSTFSNQPFYKFIRTNLPSENNFEFSIIFPEKSGYHKKYLSPEALVSNTNKGIQAFAFSFSATESKFVPINIYLRFK